jgi:hypothetical protein
MSGRFITSALRYCAPRASSRPAPASTRTRLNLEPLADRIVPAFGSISGTVYQDLTGNGLTSDDTGLGGVDVRLYRDANRDGVLNRGDWRIGQDETAADGSYDFNWLRAGTYFVVEKERCRLVRTAPTLDEYRTVELGDGAQVARQDFAFFRKLNRAAMDDFHFTIVSPDGTERTVQDLRGNTNAGDTVIAHFRIEWWSRPVPVSLVSYTAPSPDFDPETAGKQEIFENATGTFGPGWHSLTVHIPDTHYQVDFVLGPAIDQFGPAGSNIFYSPQCRLLSADNDAGLPPSEGGSISGRVFVDRGQDGMLDAAEGDFALGGVQVDLFLTDANGGQTLVRSVSTAADGTYVFTDLEAGTYSIVERQPNGRKEGLDYLGDAGGVDTGNDAFTGIVLETGQQAAGYVFTEFAGNASLSGFVGSPIEDPPNFMPIPGQSFTVVLEYTEADGTTITLTTQTSADDGSYAFTNLATGSYTLTLIVPEGFRATDSPLLGTVAVGPDGDPVLEGDQMGGTIIASIDLTSDNDPALSSVGANYIFLVVDLDP